MDESVHHWFLLIRQNVLITFLALAGVGGFGYGLFLMQSPEPPADIVFASNNASEKESIAETTTHLVVDVEGAVMNPGVYQLAEKSRIQDALVMAGGLNEQADREKISKTINLAQVLADGIKIYFPTITDSSKADATTENDSNLININTASSLELESLSGIGEVTAQKIIDARPFTAVDDLLTKKLVSSKTFETIKEQVTVY